MYCQSCGEEMLDQAVICMKCGVPTEKYKAATAELSVGVIALGYFISLIVPIAGMIFGLYAITRKKVEHGFGIIGLSIAVIIFYAYMMMEGRHMPW